MNNIPVAYENAVNELMQEVERFLQFNSPYPHTALTIALNNLKFVQLAIESESNSELEALRAQVEEQMRSENATIISLFGKKDLK